MNERIDSNQLMSAEQMVALEDAVASAETQQRADAEINGSGSGISSTPGPAELTELDLEALKSMDVNEKEAYLALYLAPILDQYATHLRTGKVCRADIDELISTVVRVQVTEDKVEVGIVIGVVPATSEVQVFLFSADGQRVILTPKRNIEPFVASMMVLQKLYDVRTRVLAIEGGFSLALQRIEELSAKVEELEKERAVRHAAVNTPATAPATTSANTTSSNPSASNKRR